MDIVYFLASFGILAGIYAIFTLGLNVHWGYTGLFNIGVAGFFALGAYTSALLTTAPPSAELFEDFLYGGNLAAELKFGVDAWFVFAIAAAAAVSGIVALVVGAITLRLRDDYLAISTLGIAESVRLIFLNEKWLGNGSRGLYDIPKFLGDRVPPDQYDLLYCVVVIVVLAALYFAIQRAIGSPWGRVLRAIREDEEATAAAGKNVFRFKLQAFVMGAAVMGIGGALYAHGFRYVDPFIFDPLLATFIIWVMLMVGGSGNNLGAMLGAFIVWGIWSGTQFLANIVDTGVQFMPDIIQAPAQLLSSVAGNPNLRFFLIGFLLVLVILLRPNGMLGERRRVSSEG